MISTTSTTINIEDDDGTHLTVLLRNLHDWHLLWVLLHLFHNLADHVDEHLTLLLRQKILSDLMDESSLLPNF